ncbi:hypothetical protein [Sporichthya polymorpha]|uniref:hypothetical protein n=1 Tax=Sporichthya polymorpha TaxID=35751 RepID=UPI000368FAD6|nr:hypothetical protein [Sporichthya polymorpha]
MTLRQDNRHSTRAAIRQAERDAKVITPALRAALDAVMTGAFADAQSKIHRDSGALAASGRHGTSVRDDGDTWIGWMAWGGEHGGRAVDQAIFEQAEGGQHDWLRDSHEYDDAIEATIDAHIRAHLA